MSEKPLPPERVLAKYPLTRDRRTIYRWDHESIGPLVYPEHWMAAAVELREALATVLEQQREDHKIVEQAKRLSQHSRLLFVAKRVLIGALDRADLEIAVHEHEALLADGPLPDLGAR